jgi:hypothetical protein
MQSLDWKDDRHLTVQSIRFLVTANESEYLAFKSTPAEFIIIKSRSLIERQLSLLTPSVENIFELGVWQGGSAVLWDQLFRPKKLVTVDWNRDERPALREYIRSHDRQSALRPYFGVNQKDVGRLQEIVGREFGESLLDLVIDDASHFYAESRASFLTLFPFLAPGGQYIIEDWGWAHWSSNLWQTPYFVGKTPMNVLMLEIAALVAAQPEIATEMRVFPDMLAVTRGPAELKGTDRDLSKHFRLRGIPIANSGDA